MALKELDTDETTRLCIYTVSAPHSHRVLIIQSATINISVAFFWGVYHYLVGQAFCAFRSKMVYVP